MNNYKIIIKLLSQYQIIIDKIESSSNESEIKSLVRTLKKIENKVTEIKPISWPELLVKIKFIRQSLKYSTINKNDILGKLILSIFHDIQNNKQKK